MEEHGEFTVVFIGDPGNTAILSSRLQEVGIEAFVKDESLVPFGFAGSVGRGVYKVIIPTADADAARPIIDQFLDEEAIDVSEDEEEG